MSDSLIDWAQELEQLRDKLLKLNPSLVDKIGEFRKNYLIHDKLDDVNYLFDFERFLKRELNNYEAVRRSLT